MFVLTQHLVERLAFGAAKGLLPEHVKNFGERSTGAALDLAVEFDEGDVQPFSQECAKGGLAAAAQSDQRNALPVAILGDGAEMRGDELAGFHQHIGRQPFEKLCEQQEIERRFGPLLHQLRHRQPDGARDPPQQHDRTISEAGFHLRDIALRHLGLLGQCLARHAALMPQRAHAFAEAVQINIGLADGRGLGLRGADGRGGFGRGSVDGGGFHGFRLPCIIMRKQVNFRLRIIVPRCDGLLLLLSYCKIMHGGMAAVGNDRQGAKMSTMNTIDFQTDPSRYKHWRIERDGDVAYLIMDVDQSGGLGEGYELKLNSYDLGVDIELNDAVQRLRFEHPGVSAVVITSGKDNVFCAGANIRYLGKATHGHKVNFCKFTNETRLAIEDASANSGQTYICAINGNAAGGGYELALAADHIMLVDDRRSAVALPETPLLAVLPGTGGLTRVTDKRKVRRDRADVFCSIEEGIRGAKAVEWRLVDEVVPNSKWKETVAARAKDIAVRSDRQKDAKGIVLSPLERKIEKDRVSYSHVDVEIDRSRGLVTIAVHGLSLIHISEP